MWCKNIRPWIVSLTFDLYVFILHSSNPFVEGVICGYEFQNPSRSLKDMETVLWDAREQNRVKYHSSVTRSKLCNPLPDTNATHISWKCDQRKYMKNRAIIPHWRIKHLLLRSNCSTFQNVFINIQNPNFLFWKIENDVMV